MLAIMASFFKTNSVKDFPASKVSCSSSRISNNVTSNMNVLPAIPQADLDASISPISKEIEYRLKVLHKILPHEQILKLSQNFISQLNSACFDKMAESVCANSVAPSTYGGTNSVCSSTVSQRLNPRGRTVPNGMTNPPLAVPNQRNDVTQLLFNAARNVRSAKDELETINEEPQAVGLVINSSREKPTSKGRSKMPLKSIAALPSQNEDDSICFRKPLAPSRNPKHKSSKKNTDSPTLRVNSKKKKANNDSNASVTDLDLTITRTSLRSNSRARNDVIPTKKKESKSSRAAINNITDYFDEDDEPREGEINPVLPLMSRPKKTALSPFFNRFKQRCNTNRTTSTPLKL